MRKPNIHLSSPHEVEKTSSSNIEYQEVEYFANREIFIVKDPLEAFHILPPTPFTTFHRQWWRTYEERCTTACIMEGT